MPIRVHDAQKPLRAVRGGAGAGGPRGHARHSMHRPAAGCSLDTPRHLRPIRRHMACERVYSVGSRGAGRDRRGGRPTLCVARRWVRTHLARADDGRARESDAARAERAAGGRIRPVGGSGSFVTLVLSDHASLIRPTLGAGWAVARFFRVGLGCRAGRLVWGGSEFGAKDGRCGTSPFLAGRWLGRGRSRCSVGSRCADPTYASGGLEALAGSDDAPGVRVADPRRAWSGPRVAPSSPTLFMWRRRSRRLSM